MFQAAKIVRLQRLSASDSISLQWDMEIDAIIVCPQRLEVPITKYHMFIRGNWLKYHLIRSVVWSIRVVFI